MGYRSFIVCAEATSARMAYQQLCNESVYGDASTAHFDDINACNFCGSSFIFQKYTKTAEEEAEKRIYQELGEMPKYNARCFDLGVVYYNIRSVGACKKVDSIPKKMPHDSQLEAVHKYIFYGIVAE